MGYDCPGCTDTGEFEHQSCKGWGCADCDSGSIPYPDCGRYVLSTNGHGGSRLVEAAPRLNPGRGRTRVRPVFGDGRHE